MPPKWLRFGNSNKSTRSNYGLTSLGKKKAEEFSETTPKNKVLAYLNENGVSTVPEVANDLGCSPQKAKMVINSLEKDGYVRPVGQEEG